jgi:serine/threonine-protein kinase SRPK3
VGKTHILNSNNTFYTIKIGTKNLIGGGHREAAIYEHIQALDSEHVGRGHIRKLHEAFELSGPDGQHYCLVHPPLGMSIDEFQQTFPDGQYPPVILKPLIRCLLQALDFLHSEAGVIHTGRSNL